ncbi:hypothetical protein [Embleya hyalina]|uniref:Lipoprotein n=1 Tax=Embleya hyalina TaxID=516124 RepID=A0A401Z444_9ACTN|nr:hypothetical protein [Embleya hyalina]GCE01622.1 hypothetical protein EHYA_09389 [Embleya hyalina]
MAVLVLVVAVVAAIGFVVFARGHGSDPEQKAAAPARPPQGPAGRPPVTLIGDGSTSNTGEQPNRPRPEKLAPGAIPPQFVVFSWDGAGEDDKKLFSRFRQVAKESNARMTLFLSGVYVLPEAGKARYQPPHKPIGASDIGYLDDAHLRMTLEQLGAAWQEGHEIGTHFNGHFCGPTGGGSWSADDWRSEVDQARAFVKNWKTNTGWADLPALPFDYDKELIGGRAPCLEGQKALLAAEPSLGFRYDASSPGGRQVWPDKVNGVWDLPLQQIPLPGRRFEVLSMDYNVMFNQSRTVKGDPARFGEWEDQAYASYMAGFDRAYTGNRAPLLIGNHFEGWNGGIYMKAVERAMRTACARPETRCVSFHDLVDWLDAQDPAVLAKLRTFDVGAKPDWAALGAPPAPAAPAAPGAPGARPAAVVRDRH